MKTNKEVIQDEEQAPLSIVELSNIQGFWEFVDVHKAEEVHTLRLKYHDAAPWVDAAITQIWCRQRFSHKVGPLIDAFPCFLFADSLEGEQCTSTLLAQYHSSMIAPQQSVVDMTAGLGVDCFFWAARATKVTACEIDPQRASVLKYNAAGLNRDNIVVVEGDSVKALNLGILKCDVVFIDPARRAQDGHRVFALEQCEPDITSLLKPMRQCFRTLVAKLSPMLDVTAVARALPGTFEICAIGTATECKELVAMVDLQNCDDGYEICEANKITLKAATLGGNYDTLAGTMGELKTDNSVANVESGATFPTAFEMPTVGSFVVLPFATIVKTGLYGLFCKKYGLTAVAANTHVFWNPTRPNENIPGRVYKVEDILPWQSKVIKRFKSRWPNVHVTVRNFGIAADELAKRLGVQARGDLRVLGVTDASKTRYLLILKPA